MIITRSQLRELIIEQIRRPVAVSASGGPLSSGEVTYEYTDDQIEELLDLDNDELQQHERKFLMSNQAAEWMKKHGRSADAAQWGRIRSGQEWNTGVNRKPPSNPPKNISAPGPEHAFTGPTQDMLGTAGEEINFKKIAEWNQEFIKQYRPGSRGAKIITPYIKHSAFKTGENLSPEDSYKSFFNEYLKPRLTLDIPGIQSGETKLIVDPSLAQGVGGRFIGGPRGSEIKLNPIHWKGRRDYNRKYSLIHELEHAASFAIGTKVPWDKMNPGSSQSINITGQDRHYDSVFGYEYLPKWVNDLRDTRTWLNSTELKRSNKMLRHLMIKPRGEYSTDWTEEEKHSVDWGKRKEEQRAVIKTWLSKNSEERGDTTLTPGLVRKLCGLKDELKKKFSEGGEYWETTDNAAHNFIANFQYDVIHPQVLLQINCNDVASLIKSTNLIVKADTPDEGPVVAEALIRMMIRETIKKS